MMVLHFKSHTYTLKDARTQTYSAFVYGRLAVSQGHSHKAVTVDDSGKIKGCGSCEYRARTLAGP